MSDLQILIDMGFSQDRAEKALEVTNNRGFEPAMEWLLAHVDELNAQTDAPVAIATTPSELAAEADTPSGIDNSATPQEAAGASSNIQQVATSTSAAPAAEAKSLKCDDCNRLFKSQMEAEYHAAKTSHKNFSESTEEKKPLTEDEKKQQMVLLEEKLRRKRLEREDREKQEALDRERVRIKSGKDMSEAQRRMEEMEMKKLVEQRKREKQDEKFARERVRAQIEADKAARRERMAIETGKAPTPPVLVVPLVPIPLTSPSTPRAPANYTNTRIQVRLQDGTALTETFDVKEQLSAVRLFVQLKQANDAPFALMTTFPRKVFQDDDYDKPLEILGLVPSAVLIVTKPQA